MDGSFSEAEILIAIFIGILMMLFLALAFVLFFYFSQKKFQAQQLKAQQKELKHQEQLLYSSIVVQENERQRIARELHDEVGSKLNVINLSLHQLKRFTQGEAAGFLDEIFTVVSTTLDTTRNISYDLLPPVLESFGLAAAIEELCEKYQQASSPEITFRQHKNEENNIPRNISLNLFRVSQELLSNGIKYANAKSVNIDLWLEQEKITLSYKDDGQGFDADDPGFKPGLGLQNIESRMRMISAEYQLDSKIDKGVYFQAKVLLK